MNLTCLLASAQSPSLSDTIPHLVGMFLVLVTLSTLWGICAIIARIVRIFAPEKPQAQPAKPAATAAAPTTAAGKIPPEIVTVIAAAVATTIGKSSRIVSIRSDSQAWQKAGRQSVLSSHRIR